METLTTVEKARKNLYQSIYSKLDTRWKFMPWSLFYRETVSIPCRIGSWVGIQPVLDRVEKKTSRHFQKSDDDLSNP
jgi:hypothetical protein